MTTKTRRPRRTIRQRAKLAPTFPDTLRTSERSTLNRCRQRWDWGYNGKLRPRREAPALRFGTLIHKALEIWYDPDRAHRRTLLAELRLKPGRALRLSVIFDALYEAELAATQKEWMKWRDEEDEWHEYHQLGMVMLSGYLEHWGNAAQYNDGEFVVLAVEQRFQTMIPVPSGKAALISPSPKFYVGTVDRVLYHLPSRRLLFGDYKTTKNDPTKNKHLSLDEQAGAYWALGPDWLRDEAPDRVRRELFKASEHLPPQHRKAITEFRFDGILYDFLKKDLPDDRPVDEQGYAVNKPKKDSLVYKARVLDIPNCRGMKVDELIEAIDSRMGEVGWAHTNLGEVSKKQPGPLFHRETVFRDAADRTNVLNRIYEDAKEIGKLRTGELAMKKSPDRFICIGCQFVDMCELHETGADWEAFRAGMYETYNPYSTYEIDWDELN